MEELIGLISSIAAWHPRLWNLPLGWSLLNFAYVGGAAGLLPHQASMIDEAGGNYEGQAILDKFNQIKASLRQNS